MTIADASLNKLLSLKKNKIDSLESPGQINRNIALYFKYMDYVLI